MIPPLETSIFYWYTWEPQYALKPAEPASEATEGSCAGGESAPAALAEPLYVLTGYQWVRHQTVLASQNQAFQQEVDTRLAEADRKVQDRAREAQRVETPPPVGPDTGKKTDAP